MYGFTRNSLIILAFFCILGALVPSYIPGQGDNSRIEIQQDDLRLRLDKQDVRDAVVDEKLSTLAAQMKESRDWQDSMGNRLNVFLAGFLMFVAKQMFERAFGGRFGDKKGKTDA